MATMTCWEGEIAEFLNHLSSVQTEVLDVLNRRRQLLADSDAEGLDTLNADEQRVLAKLQECLADREALLERAAEDGLPGDSIKSLQAALPAAERSELRDKIREAEHQAQLLRLGSITNWVVVQRNLLHLSQMLEIIATRGRMKATYGDKSGQARTSDASSADGVLMDRVA